MTFTVFEGMDLVVRQGCDDFAPDALAPDPVMRDFCTSCLGHRFHHIEN